jgi:hypothetical protein
MRKFVSAAAVIAALVAAPVLAAGQATPSSASKPKPAASKPSMATHSTSGVVKSMDASTLGITKAGKKPEEMTFVVNSTTQKQGNPEVGSTVTVRYTTEGTSHTATAIVAKAAKPAKK